MLTVVALSSGATYATITGVPDLLHSATSSAQLLGHVEVVVRNTDGDITAYRQSDNMIVSSGMREIGDGVFEGINATNVKMEYIGIGDGSTAPAASDVNLESPINPGGCSREDIDDGTQPALPAMAVGTMNGSPNANVTITATFDGATCSDNDIQEAGLFNHVTGGQMFARNSFTSVNLQASDTLDLTWIFQFTDT